VEECSLRLFRGCHELYSLKLGFWYACGYSSVFAHLFTEGVDSEFFHLHTFLFPGNTHYVHCVSDISIVVLYFQEGLGVFGFIILVR